MKTKNKTKEPFDFRKIETIQDAFTRMGMSPTEVPDVSKIPERFREPLLAVYNLMVAHEAVNDGWEADYSKYQQKWFAWPRALSAGSGFVFSGSDYRCVGTGAVVGSRLCTESMEKSKHLFEKFNEDYRKFMLKK